MQSEEIPNQVRDLLFAILEWGSVGTYEIVEVSEFSVTFVLDQGGNVSISLERSKIKPTEDPGFYSSCMGSITLHDTPL